MTALLVLLMSCASEAPDEITLLTPREQLIRLSVDLRGVHPTEDELLAIEETPELYEQYVDRYIEDPRFVTQMRGVFNLRFLTDTGYPYGYSYEGSTGTQLANAIGQEPLRLLSHIIENDLPYDEIVLADYTVANELTAAMWDLDYSGDGDWEVSYYTDGRPQAGILTMNATMLRYPSMGGNANRHRANAVSKMLLCDDYLERPIVLNRSAVDQLTIDPESAISENEGCQSCHASLDPLSAHFFGFFYMNDDGDSTEYRPENEEGWREYANKAPAYYGRPTANLQELGEAIADDPRFVDCAVQTVFEGLGQRELMDEDWAEFQQYRDAFQDADLNIKALVREMVLARTYRAAMSDDPDEAERLATIKIASPSQLANIIEDITDYRWSFSNNDGLTTHNLGLPVLLGGIDADAVTIRSFSPGVGAVFIQERLAQSAGYHVASHDLAVDRSGDAILLPYVNRDSRPETDADAFTAQIHYLYLHITGLPLEEEAWEPEALTDVWSQLYTIEGDPVQAWSGVISAVLRDPRVLTY